MLSSHHGESATPAIASPSSNTSQPIYNGDHDQLKTSIGESYASKMGRDEVMNSMDTARSSPKRHVSKGINVSSNMAEIFSPPIKPASLPFGERLQHKDLFISTDLHRSIYNADHSTLLNTPLTPAVHASPYSQLQQQQLQSPNPSASNQQRLNARHSRSAGSESDIPDYVLNDTPPANCKVPLDLSRRSSFHTMMSPPPSGGLIKSTTAHTLYSANERHGDAVKFTDINSPKPRALQKRRSNTSNSTRRHSVPNNVHNISVTAAPLNVTIQRLGMGQSTLDAQGPGMNDPYLPTPTDSAFRPSITGDSTTNMDFTTQITSAIPSFLSSTSVGTAYSIGVHPFDVMPALNTADAWPAGDVSGMSGMPGMSLPMSNATKSATIQYLQQLQQSIMQQPNVSNTSQVLQQQQQGAPLQQVQQMDALLVQSKQQKSSQPGQGSQSRRGSKAKAKRRVGSLPAPPATPSYMSAEMPWSSLSSHMQQVAAQTILPSQQYSSAEILALTNNQPIISPAFSTSPSPSSAETAQSPSNLATYYRGPAPCGNPEPLYEYLASPTVVPGLEIIGHDYYGNYVQILPICPETTCSMNQDPVYLNLLQAIYAHTIPFLDLAPGSEEETQRLMNGTHSAISTQSIQPPFKHLLPLNGSAGIGTQATLGNQRSMTTSVSAPSFQQPSDNNKLVRRASVASISSTLASGSRKASTVSNPSLNNPARKKKNVPRTHPYKSTSVFKEDNPMVTEAILTQVGGLGGIGNSATVSATDPRHKVAEKMVHMDEAEYAVHYSKHYQSMNKSVSTINLCLAQTLATPMPGSGQGAPNPSLLMSSSVSAPSIANATTNSVSGSASSPLETIAAADFIRALSECNGGMNDLGINTNELTSVVSDMNFAQNDLASLESLMRMDSNAVATMHAAASATWPHWFDLNQLEKDICQEGMTHQASAFSSASCSRNNLPLTSSTTLASFAGISRDSTSTNLLLSSSTDLAMMEGLLDDNHPLISKSSSDSSQDSEMTLAPPASSAYHQNSTSQVLVFDQYPGPPQAQSGSSSFDHSGPPTSSSTSSCSGSNGGSQPSELKKSISNDLGIPYTSSLLTVLPFSAEHSHPIFPTRGNRRSGWYRSKSVASQGLSEITGVDYTTTCWYDVERLQSVVRESISFQESSALKSLEDLTNSNPPKEIT
ncbi:hypothetical protein BC939DRAFT_226728 [Gamsiella multidivaricata]|uniref:uncharacterized protein n=1 Tax=Gamsiella multidivaricata TaxID=101098 RepID=UPI00221F4FA4|nr:uncharacterized protein BC939DRAFT_226728 [Gamsiella multidivaricata]KAG0362287.1 hypothetical protein BGZ54_008690 [Gamsiella multidivaricata]KAI7831323.1 hypothetical protein BC939DRAFT_226728 [Gamsiella multidivaricata]